MDELKSCPFCGGKPFRQIEYKNGFRGIVRCPVCRIEISEKRQNDFGWIGEEGIIELLTKVTKSWNKRE